MPTILFSLMNLSFKSKARGAEIEAFPIPSVTYKNCIKTLRDQRDFLEASREFIACLFYDLM